MRGWRKICSDGGAAIVETAFAAAVTLALLVGNFQMFSALYTYHYVSYAAREGSRYAIVRGSQCATDSATMPNCNATSAEIQTYVESLGFPGINTNDMTVTTTWLNASATQPRHGQLAPVVVATFRGTWSRST